MTDIERCLEILDELVADESRYGCDGECPEAEVGAKRIRVRLLGEPCPDCADDARLGRASPLNLAGWWRGWQWLAGRDPRWPGQAVREVRLRPWHPSVCETCLTTRPDEMAEVVARAVAA